MINIVDLTNIGRSEGASDIHISVGVPATIRVDGNLIPINNKVLNKEDVKKLIYEITNEKDIKKLDTKGEVDFTYSNLGEDRYRVNIFKQRGNYSMVLRIIPSEIPKIESLGLPNILKDLSMLKQGLILVTGPTGSGKSTTLATMIEFINKEKNCHILTLEDPIEYVHKHNNSIINQREVGKDTQNFSVALRAALRQDPDVILVGEMRDLETISTVLTAAETGHLVLSSLHTLGAAKTINRIIDVFPSDQQQQIRNQLAEVLQAVLSQKLLPKINTEGRVAACEIMISTQAVRNLIRENKIHQIDNVIETGTKYGMQNFNSELINLYEKGIINKKETILD